MRDPRKSREDTRGDVRNLSREGDDTREYERNGGRGNNGWVPVLRYHRSSNGRNGDNEIYTLFVDNIPEEKGQHWLFRTFSKYGVVKEAFIPRKRSVRTGSKFGFVRHDCHVAAGMAVSKLNGIWVDNSRLFVREAAFGINEGKTKPKIPRFQDVRIQGSAPKPKTIPNLNPTRLERKVINGDIGSIWHNNQPGRTYAGVLRGEMSKLAPSPSQDIVIRSENVGSGWLYRSAVAVLKRVVPLLTVKVSFSRETGREALFRSMGLSCV